MKCASCGNEIRDGLKFCPSCGTRVNATVQMPPVGNSTAQQQATYQQQQQPAYGYQAQPAYQQGIPQPAYQGAGMNPNMAAPKKSHTGPIIGAICAAVAVVVAIVLVIVLTGRSVDYSSPEGVTKAYVNILSETCNQVFSGGSLDSSAIEAACSKVIDLAPEEWQDEMRDLIEDSFDDLDDSLGYLGLVDTSGISVDFEMGDVDHLTSSELDSQVSSLEKTYGSLDDSPSDGATCEVTMTMSFSDELIEALGAESYVGADGTYEVGSFDVVLIEIGSRWYLASGEM